ncbi:MAG TPA: replicative DNA helicase, partial [Candidatus Omnitrophica bacterium]|nr:replicative DNA helicase [Candidatus Omnitrophota bacterium]
QGDDKARRPTMSDLRESGELEHDADVILLLHRLPMKPETEAIMAKVRDGAVGIAKLIFHSETVRFTEESDRAE